MSLFVCLFQLTHLAEMRHKEHDHHYAVVVSTFIIWSKFNVFQPYCQKNFSIVKELKVVATFIVYSTFQYGSLFLFFKQTASFYGILGWNRTSDT